MPKKTFNLRNLLYEGLNSSLQVLKLEQSYFLGTILGEIIWHGSPFRRKLAIQAISYHLQKKPQAAKRIARQSFRHTGRSFVELFLIRQLDPRFIDSNVLIKNPENLKQIVEANRPIVGITGHLGAWELLSSILAIYFQDRPRQIIVKPSKRDQAFSELLSHCRQLGNSDIVYSKQASSHIIKCLRNTGISSFLVDQNTRRSKAIFLPFMRSHASVNIGPALLAIRTKALIWPIFMIRNGQGKYLLDSAAPLDTLELKGKMKDKVKAAASFYTQSVQKIAQDYPEQWFWMHKRWKTRPKQEKA